MADGKSVLGKGLGSLIPSAGQRGSWGPTITNVAPGEQVVKISASAISANPWQPRTHFDQDRLHELAASIKEHGILQPLIVTDAGGGKYQLVAGERRLKAAQLIGITEVPCIVRKIEDQKKLEVSLIENLQRHNLNALEEALGYKRLMDEFGLTQEEVAARVGKSRSSVANFLRVLSLPQSILEALAEERITFSHAKVILSYPAEKDQLKALELILKQKLSVAAASRPVRNPRASASDPVLASWEEKLTEHFGFRTRIKKLGKGGSIEIQFPSDEDLKSILDKLIPLA